MNDKINGFGGEHGRTTKDRFEVAYYMTYGFVVQEVKFLKEKDRIVPEFTITGDGLSRVVKRYHENKALLNLAEFEVKIKQVDELVKNELDIYLGGGSEV